MLLSIDWWTSYPHDWVESIRVTTPIRGHWPFIHFTFFLRFASAAFPKLKPCARRG